MINNKGVSIVALVITIIVLLILSAITLSVAFGNNGIITKAQESKKKTEMSQTEETLKSAIMELQVEKDGNANLTDLKNLINSNKIENVSIYQDNNTAIDINYNNQYIYTIDNNFNISNQRDYSENALSKTQPQLVFDEFDRTEE